MAACTCHLFDNSAALKGLVVLQAGLTLVGNVTLAAATWNLLRQQRRSDLRFATTATGPNPSGAQDAAPRPLQP